MPTAHLALRAGEREQFYSFSGEAVIGRGAGADVSIPDPSISRRHALARLEGKTVVLEDLGSANGTYLNGTAVRSATRADHGDTLRFGAVEVELRIEEGGTEEQLADPVATPTEILRSEEG
jgi:pSer/pThr/pTyr-binding forkhead associated (FHA) protein